MSQSIAQLGLIANGLSLKWHDGCNGENEKRFIQREDARHEGNAIEGKGEARKKRELLQLDAFGGGGQSGQRKVVIFFDKVLPFPTQDKSEELFYEWL